MRGGKSHAYFVALIFLFLVGSMFFISAVFYDRISSGQTASAGDTISVLTFNATNTSAVSATNLTLITVLLTGNATYTNVTSVNISDGTNDYSNNSLSGSTVTIDVSDAQLSAQTNFTLSITLSSSALYGFAAGANITAITNQTNVSYSSPPYYSSLAIISESTVPTALARCSPNTIVIGDSFPCTCSGTDSGTTNSGVASSSGSSNSADGTSSPSSIGDFIYTCTVTDNAGNSASDTEKYYVVGGGGAALTGGSTTQNKWKNTYIISESSFKEGYDNSLGVNDRVKFNLGVQEHHVGVTSVSGTQVTLEIASDPFEVTLQLGDEMKFDVDGDGFYDVSVMVNSLDGTKADLMIMEASGAVPEDSTGTGTSNSGASDSSSESKASYGFIWVIVVVVVLLILWKGLSKKKKRR